MDKKQVELLKENGFPYPLNVLDFLKDDFDHETTIESVMKGKVIKDIGTFSQYESDKAGVSTMYQVFEDNSFVLISSEVPEAWEDIPSLYVVEDMKCIEYIDVLDTFSSKNPEFAESEIKRAREEKKRKYAHHVPMMYNEIVALKRVLKDSAIDNPDLKALSDKLNRKDTVWGHME